MAYSDTTNKTKINVGQLIEFAFREAGKTAEEQTPQYIDSAKQALFYILQNLSNRGVNLWMLENVLIGLKSNQTIVEMPEGTVDVRESNWRYIVTPEVQLALPIDNFDSPALFDGNLSTHATSTTQKNWFGAEYSQAQRMFQVGWNSFGGGVYNFALETSEDGITWTEVQKFPQTVLADGEWAYYPVLYTNPYKFFRLRETVAQTFSLRQIVFSYTQQDIPMARLNRDDYWSLPNKQFQGPRPLQFWFDRKITPRMYVWPIPQDDFQVIQLIIEKQLQDVGVLTNELYIPNRWVGAVQALLSHKISLQLPNVDLNRIAYLEKQAATWLSQAEDEERDKSPIYFQPNIRYYTR